MTGLQWETLLKVIKGEVVKEKPVGFIIDSPWLPGWYNVSALDYFTHPDIWYEANLKAINTFPEVIFLPGFWSEFGMCTEPSAFGSKMIWHENNLPHAERIITDITLLGDLVKPNVKTDGLLPFMIKRLSHHEKRINDKGHQIKFAIARGPLNIASFLAGTTEFMMGIALSPEETNKGLTIISDFIIDWISLQLETFKDIDGILLLDDIVGFVGEDDFKNFALPHLKRIYESFDVKVKFFHNDAPGLICAPYLNEIGINFFNFGFEHGLQEMKDLTNNKVTLLGNIPPRDVLANGTTEDINRFVNNAMDSVKDHTRIIWSIGGGMPQDVSTENIMAFINAVKSRS
jgi:uroporphyrinogen-III decarboxylase